MKQIEEAINQLKSIGVQTVRQNTSFSFGTYQDCRIILNHYFHVLDQTVSNFEWLPEYEEVAKWMSNTQGKGLLLMGDCGRGKSTILTSVLPFIFYRQFDKIIKPISAKELNMPDEKRGRFTVGWPAIARRPFIAIDELGTEEKETNYGEPYEPFCKVIDEAENFLKPLFITTNLTTEQILDRYDERTLDRIIRLCKIVKFEGGSFRK